MRCVLYFRAHILFVQPNHNAHDPTGCRSCVRCTVQIETHKLSMLPDPNLFNFWRGSKIKYESRTNYIGPCMYLQ